eukprot:3368195-Prymnesium_polylepis.1
MATVIVLQLLSTLHDEVGRLINGTAHFVENEGKPIVQMHEHAPGKLLSDAVAVVHCERVTLLRRRWGDRAIVFSLLEGELATN